MPVHNKEQQNTMKELSGLHDSCTDKHLQNLLKKNILRSVYYYLMHKEEKCAIDKKTDPATERVRIVLAAADII
ncbi:hypothetical protein PR048_010321 [Dryococelus australis]|uniref:Uncharacterized protein n=1 Tax=Dryococelus australis TaxID=614101 RepID=A0ABQ9I2V5_9NEOP|nr:hypothetical protein PR048_010321 [Dryococelus australis]